MLQILNPLCQKDHFEACFNDNDNVCKKNLVAYPSSIWLSL